MSFINDETDPITPTIEHHVDEVLDARGRREQLYNYIDYHFEDASAYVRARTYFPTPSVVDVYGPFRSRTSIESVQSTALMEAATAYLMRRFTKVRAGAKA